MHPVFMASGPVFKKNFTQEKIAYSVDVYPLMCYILGISHGVINGTLDNFKDLIVYDFRQYRFYIDNIFNMGFFIFLIFFLILFVQFKLTVVNRSFTQKKVLTSTISSARLI